MTSPERLEEGTEYGSYYYFEHSDFPLVISLEETDDTISVSIVKLYKMKEVKRLDKKVAKLGVMTKEQKEEFILDVVDIFLK